MRPGIAGPFFARNGVAATESMPGIGIVKPARAAGHPAIAYNVEDPKTMFFAAYY